ncbi:hypothetical protein CUMW_190060 [Citrus unshiu]|uniref:Protein kinase domain-containing protein n=1 Tax=Citrus unshiu TaxID=55188 RepID=A0A2H5Q2Q5_CITUN|nr:hypothetical protein CUMW_190060 [Citrus unshiu]
MNLQLLFQVIILLLPWPIKSIAKAPPHLTKPNCPSNCGNNVTIPFPFGTGENCYFDQRYAIDCKSNKPILRIINLEVLEFFLEKSTMSVNQSVIRSCQDKITEASFVNLEKLPFYFSYHDNIFSGIGCNNLASMSPADHDFILGGCLSICDPRNKTDDDSCNGIGCCKAGSAEAVQDWNQVPVILDWWIPNSSFGKLEKDESHCESDESGPLRCSCKEKYHGNPYLHGCQGFSKLEIGLKATLRVLKILMSMRIELPLALKICSVKTMKEATVALLPNGRKFKLNVEGIGSGLLGSFLFAGVWWLRIWVKKREDIKLKEKFFKRNGGLLLQKQLTSFDGSIDRCKLFTTKELDKATDHFNVNRILGQGGQGTVYKGMLADGRIVAVKKSKIVHEGKLEEFINEVVILLQINHRNVVKLLGCCLETEVPLLVYEFISNGTLFQYLHDQNEEFPLTWEMRLRIATEVAGSLSYLHSAASMPIYHRDIKSTNILLGEKYKAKVADFGTSKFIAIDQTHVTTKVQGTFGYLDPEYFRSGQFTDKSDVYSFGVVLVELLTGQKPIILTGSKEATGLAAYFILSMEENRLYDFLDDQALKVGQKEEIMTIANLATRCLNLSGKRRPTMKEVAMELERIQNEFKHYKKISMLSKFVMRLGLVI